MCVARRAFVVVATVRIIALLLVLRESAGPRQLDIPGAVRLIGISRAIGILAFREPGALFLIALGRTLGLVARPRFGLDLRLRLGNIVAQFYELLLPALILVRRIASLPALAAAFAATTAGPVSSALAIALALAGAVLAA